MPRPSQERKILDAALQCFAELGYEGTRVRHITERAGVSEGALYRHYPSKGAIAQALHAHYFGEFSGRLARIAASPLPPEGQLREIARVSLTTYREQPAAFSFVFLSMPAFTPQLASDTVYPGEVVARIIAAGQRAGTVREGQPNLLTDIFMGCILQPMIASNLAGPGKLNLMRDERHDRVIMEAAWAAVARPIPLPIQVPGTTTKPGYPTGPVPARAARPARRLEMNMDED